MAEFERLTLEDLALEPDTLQLLHRDIPEFENIFSGVEMIAKTHGCGLEVGDLVVRIEGEPIGDQFEKIKWLMDTSNGKSITIRVIRGGKIKDIEVKVLTSVLDERATREQYLMSSGVVFQTMEPIISFNLFDGVEGVLVTRMIPLDAADQMTKLESGVVVTDAFANRKQHRIRNIWDLEKVFRSVPEGTYVRLITYRPVPYKGEEGYKLLMERSPEVEMFPVSKTISSDQLPLKNLKEEFDFSGRNINSRLIQNRLPSVCAKDLRRLGGSKST